jgi:hypothetical protein
MMKLRDITNIQSLDMVQSLTIKGGARDTRGGKTTTTSTIRDTGTKTKV